MNEKKENVKKDDNRNLSSNIFNKKYSLKTLFSFSIVYLGIGLANNFVSGRIIYFYSVEVLLPEILIVLAVIFYVLWDMFNDLLIGHLSDRNNRFTRRWGKRFPWIIISGVLLSFFIILVFTPPVLIQNPWSIFFYFIITWCIFDGLYSMLYVNSMALIPNKFRLPEQRTNLAGLAMIFSTIGLFIAYLLPGLILSKYGDLTSYIPLLLIIGMIIFISMFFSLYGIRENDDMINLYFKVNGLEQKMNFKSEFVNMLKTSLRQKYFRIILLYSICAGVLQALLISSIPFFIRYVLMGNPETEVIILIPYLLANMLFLPLWAFIAKKISHTKFFKILLLFEPFTLLFLFFSTSLVTIIIAIFLIGVVQGAIGMLQTPIQADFFDQTAVLNGKRQEGIYIGIHTFFGRISILIQVISIWLVHLLTGFIQTATAQDEFAQLGIRIHMALIPMVFSIIAAIVIWKWWDLNDEKMLEIRVQLKKMEI